MTRYVLVPGAGGAAWYWSRVAALLTQAGHEPHPIDLPGDDETAGLAEYVELICAAAGHEPDTVLVAQSLGGFSAPLVALRAPVRAIVLVNAMIPLPGERAGDWWENTGASAARIAAAEQHGYPVEFDLHTYFLHDVPAEIAAEGEPYQRDEAAAVFGSTCTFTSWPDVPTRVLAGADDRFFPLDFQQRVAQDRLGIDADVLPGGHLLALSQPAALTDYLRKV
jgi:pimeloyl-ACP methyl ester carboxylesterase